MVLNYNMHGTMVAKSTWGTYENLNSNTLKVSLIYMI